MSSEGLTSAQAEERLAKYGPNKLKEAEKPTLLQRFIEQLKDPMLIILMVAAADSALTCMLSGEPEWAEVIIILIVVLLNAILGVFCSTLMGFTLLNPVHLLFINLVTDCFPALALGMEEAEPDTMQRPPRDSKEGIFAGGLFVDIAYQGILVTAITILSYIIGHCMEVGYFEMPRGISPDGMTMAFLTMSMCEIFHSFNMRSQRKSVFSLKGQNKILWIAMIGSLVLTTLILEVPFLANAFGFEMISWTEYGISIALAFLVIPIVEIVKFFQSKAAKM